MSSTASSAHQVTVVLLAAVLAVAWVLGIYACVRHDREQK